MIFEAGAFNVMGIVSLRELLPIVRHVREFVLRYRTEPRGQTDDIVQAREQERIRHLKIDKPHPAKRQKLSSEDAVETGPNGSDFIEDE
jgi:hypothetical protein